MKYYMLTATFTPFMCSPIRQTLVTSEHPTKFIARNLAACDKDASARGTTYPGASLVLDAVHGEITKGEYEALRPYNPHSSSYFQMLPRDRSPR